MAEAVGGDFVEQLAPVAGRGARSSPRPSSGRAPSDSPPCSVGVDQVDVGGEIQLAAAELAQAEHHQPLRAAVGVAHARRGAARTRPSSAASADLQAAVRPARCCRRAWRRRRRGRARRARPAGSIRPRDSGAAAPASRCGCRRPAAAAARAGAVVAAASAAGRGCRTRVSIAKSLATATRCNLLRDVAGHPAGRLHRGERARRRCSARVGIGRVQLGCRSSFIAMDRIASATARRLAA